MKTWKRLFTLWMMLCMALSLMQPLTVLAVEDALPVSPDQTESTATSGMPEPNPEFTKPAPQDFDTPEDTELPADFAILLSSAGTDSTVFVELDVSGLESAHPYANSTTKTWEISATNAISISLTFDSQTFLESGYDFLYIYDENGTQHGKYSNTNLAGQTITVAGSKVTLKLTSDNSVQKWGFKVTSATAQFDDNVGGTTLPGGTCGDDLTWVLSEDGTLTISGTGTMTNWTSVTSVPWYNYCSSIQKVVIEENAASIGNYAFASCSRLTSVTLPGTLTFIGNYAFSGCYGLTGITLPDGLTSIGASAFINCYSLTDLTLPDSLTDIGECAFQSCFDLKTVAIGSGLTSIADNIFASCYELTAFTVKDGNQSFSARDGVLFNADKTTLLIYPAGKADTDYVIPNGVTTIASAAFFDCTGLQSVTMPASLTAIEAAAFYYCSGLKTITFEGSAPTIADNAFAGVNAATCCYPANGTGWTYNMRQNYGGTLTWQAYYLTFGVCGDDLTWVLSEDGTLTISGTGPMYEWESSSYVPWEGLNSSIKSVIIENGATSIGNCAFYDCYNLQNVTLPDSVTVISDYAFSFCGCLTNIVLPQNLTSLGAEAFSYCSDLKSIILPDGVTSIGQGTFKSCTNLQSVTLPKNLTSIGSYAFTYCSGLTALTIPECVTDIGDRAFAGCSSLQTIHLSKNVATIGEQVFAHHGWKTSMLQHITVDADNANYASVNGVLFNKGKTRLMAYPAGKMDTVYTIPDSVTAVDSYAFTNCTNLRSITLPTDLTTIGKQAFSGCSGLTSMTFRQKVGTLGESAFSGCSSLKTITFEGSAPVTDSYVFSGVTATCYYPASNPTWTENKRTSMGSTLTWVGTGTAGYESAKLKNGYYEIYNLSQLYWFAQYVNDGHPSVNGRLMANITANTGDVMAAGTYSEKTDYLQWIPIAIGATYTGIFDGNGYTISGLYYYCKDYTQSQTRGVFGGLFHDVSGTVCDLTLDNCFFYHYNYAASICRNNSGTIENCTVTAYVSTKGNYYQGGIAYRNLEDGTISDCTFYGRGTTAFSAYNGICYSNSGTISNCVNYSNHIRAGIASSNYGTIRDCHNYGFISGHDASVGGICAWNGGTVIDCTNAGEINGLSMNTGGICGSNAGMIRRCANTATVYSSSTYTGGICGNNDGDKVLGGVIQSCYNTGSVSSSRVYVGGICGGNEGLITGCYNAGSFRSSEGSAGSICGYNTVTQVRDSTGKITLYTNPGAVINCISYYSSTIIGQNMNDAVNKNNLFYTYLYSLSPAYLLNGMTSTGDVDWYQNIDNGQPADTYAVLDDAHGKVYRTSGSVYTNTPQADIKSGSCAWNMEWALDENGTLTITGSGSMDNFAPTDAPWYPWREEIRSVRLEGNITSVGNYAFYNCTSLTRVDLGVNVTHIGGRAFAQCPALEAFYYGVRTSGASIGECAFYDCTSLKTFALPTPVNVDAYAFHNCAAIKSFYFNYYDSYSSSYDPAIATGYNAFTGVSATLYYPVGMGEPYISEDHGGTLQLSCVPYGPCGLDTEWAFDAATGTLTISGSGVPQEYSAGDCVPWRGISTDITHIVVEEGITEISNHLFEFMRQAESISLPDTLTVLPYTALNNCENLEHLLIPANVTSLANDYGFIRCGKLTDVYYVGTAEEWAQVEYSKYLNKSNDVFIRLHCLTLHEDPPTCTEPGTEAYYSFDDRTIYSAMYNIDKEIITQLETLPATGHRNKYTVKGTAATCTAAGLTDGEYCPDCQTWLTPQTEIPAGNHANKYAGEAKEATCIAAGNTAGEYCPDCDIWLTEQEVIPATNHANKYAGEAKEATCTAAGNTAGEYCPDCDTWLTPQTEIPAGNHANKYAGEAKEATCIAAGNTAGEYCPDCDTWLTEQEEIPAKGHSKSYQIIDFELYYACDNCSERTTARSIEWNEQGITVRMEAELQPILLYSALYDMDGCMIEVRIDEVTQTEMRLSFAQMENAANVRVFFLNDDQMPVLMFFELLKTESMQ